MLHDRALRDLVIDSVVPAVVVHGRTAACDARAAAAAASAAAAAAAAGSAAASLDALGTTTAR